MAINSLKLVPLLMALMMGSVLADEATQNTNEPQGSITLYKKKNGDQYPPDCTLDLPGSGIKKKIDLRTESEDEGKCTNDEDYAFKLENIPSSTLIELWETSHCDDENNWVYRIRAIQQPSTMLKPYEIEKLDSLIVGAIIEPGFKLVYKHRDGDDEIGGKLSCITLDVPAKP